VAFVRPPLGSPAWRYPTDKCWVDRKQTAGSPYRSAETSKTGLEDILKSSLVKKLPIHKTEKFP
jgi:hypothetical protein